MLLCVVGVWVWPSSDSFFTLVLSGGHVIPGCGGSGAGHLQRGETRDHHERRVEQRRDIWKHAVPLPELREHSRELDPARDIIHPDDSNRDLHQTCMLRRRPLPQYEGRRGRVGMIMDRSSRGLTSFCDDPGGPCSTPSTASASTSSSSSPNPPTTSCTMQCDSVRVRDRCRTSMSGAHGAHTSLPNLPPSIPSLPPSLPPSLLHAARCV